MEQKTNTLNIIYFKRRVLFLINCESKEWSLEYEHVMSEEPAKSNKTLVTVIIMGSTKNYKTTDIKLFNVGFECYNHLKSNNNNIFHVKSSVMFNAFK